MNIDRGVPEVWGSVYDVRDLLNATVAIRDGRKITDMKLGLKEKIAMKELLKAVEGTDVEKLLREHGAISEKNRIINITNALAEVWFARAFLGLYDNVQAEGLPHGRFLCFGCV